MRAGLRGLRLRPAEFWALTPAELMLMLGQDGLAPRMGRARLERVGTGLSRPPERRRVMIDIDRLDGLDAEVDALERSLGDTATMAGAFDAELRAMRRAWARPTRDLGNLERGFSGGLRRAFDGLMFDGLKLSDALGVLAKSMINTAYSAAIKPVTDHFGGLLADGRQRARVSR